jgi:uncharacterized protein (DUF4415 family)
MNQDSKESSNDLIPEHRFKDGVRGKYNQRKRGEPSKVRITMYLDLDVYNYFQQRAAAPHAAPYQTQINAELRRIMEEEHHAGGDYAALLDDEQFIAAVAARVKELGLP